MEMRCKVESGVAYAHWDSLSDLESTEVTNTINSNHFHDKVINYSAGTSWWGMGTHSWQDVRRHVLGGWKEGADKGEYLKAQIAVPPVKSFRRQKVRKDFGDFLDIQRVYAGDLSRAWESSTRSAGMMRTGPNIIIALNSSIACNEHSDTLFWKGATTCAVVEALVASGRNVKVITYLASNHSGFGNGGGKDPETGSRVSTNVTSVTVKDFTQPMDRESLYAVTALAGFMRGYMLKAHSCIPWFEVSSSYGSVLKQEFVSPFWRNEGKVINIVGCGTKEQAEAKLKHIGEEIGILNGNGNRGLN